MQRLEATKIVVCAGLLSAFLLAPGLWLEDPYFGPVPIFGSWPRWPPPLDRAILGALLALLVPIAVLRRPWRWIAAWCALFALRAVPDQITWQPYFLQYFAIMLGLGLAFRPAANAGGSAARPPGDAEPFVRSLQMLLAGIYIWSGLCKLNPGFFASGAQTLLGPLLPGVELGPWARLALAAPFVEALAGAALLVPRLRLGGAAILFGMHTLILAAIGPLGTSWNAVVWPWNLAMMALLVLLFVRLPQASAFPPTLRARAYRAAVVLVFGLLPALHGLGLWPSYLSFRLYSHNEQHGFLLTTRSVLERLPPSAQEVAQPWAQPPHDVVLDLVRWSDAALGALLPPETALYRHVARKVCAHAERPGDVLLVRQGPLPIFSGRTPRHVESCAMLRPRR